MPSRVFIFCGHARAAFGIIDASRRAKRWHERFQSVGCKENSFMVESEVDLTKTYDAIVVGSGAAGGMAAHVLTSHGMQVLMIEAGKKLPIEQELKSMQWPYDHPRRGRMPADSHALTLNEYTIRPRPY